MPVLTKGEKMVFSSIGRLRMISVLEGISYLALLTFAMPIKYMAGDPEPVRIVGMAHGVLFILFVLALADVWRAHRWSLKFLLFCFACSLVPFAPFWLEGKLKERALLAAAP
jgi:integral membrane protein